MRDAAAQISSMPSLVRLSLFVPGLTLSYSRDVQGRWRSSRSGEQVTIGVVVEG